ncbi:MAG: cytochrome c biogenesis protein CcsA [Planctomycetes bacterium]|nr:cytochrome c biogenesis protein CcsA [Planctomycetota bacterium]MBU1518844.1 cytochrome c biogenesis protein CcsA [Planctomycetota bacterium]MBU2458056.1 cytochrome c biogenesis protein CcsA [Planctomycetota bacterium]MBU2596010.1 cytochrome c biogenesis protein CcsA [Planctomycetota bacterium]
MDRLKQLCLITGTVLLMSLAVLCIIGAVMGADWSKWFFAASAGKWLWVCISLLIIAGMSQFSQIYTAQWPLAVYVGALLVLAAGVTNCPCTLYAGYIIGCVGLFGLFRFKPDKFDIAAIVVLLIATVLVFSFVSLPLQLKSVFFIPHVFACFLSYIFFARASFLAAKYLFGKNPLTEETAYRLVCKGFSFLTAGIAIGSIWAAFAWGDWWGWDPKETFSLAIWLVFAAFLHFRYLYKQKFLRLNSIWIIFGFILIILSVLLVNFAKIFAGLHSHSS